MFHVLILILDAGNISSSLCTCVVHEHEASIRIAANSESPPWWTIAVARISLFASLLLLLSPDRGSQTFSNFLFAHSPSSSLSYNFTFATEE